MKITITRSFERTRQIADFVPIKAYCEVTAEVDDEELTDKGIWPTAEINNLSQHLDTITRDEVDKTLISYQPLCIVCKARGEKVVLNKEGVCGNCLNTRGMQAKENHDTVQKNKGRS